METCLALMQAVTRGLLSGQLYIRLRSLEAKFLNDLDTMACHFFRISGNEGQISSQLCAMIKALRLSAEMLML